VSRVGAVLDVVEEAVAAGLAIELGFGKRAGILVGGDDKRAGGADDLDLPGDVGTIDLFVEHHLDLETKLLNLIANALGRFFAIVGVLNVTVEEAKDWVSVVVRLKFAVGVLFLLGLDHRHEGLTHGAFVVAAAGTTNCLPPLGWAFRVRSLPFVRHVVGTRLWSRRYILGLSDISDVE